MHLQRFFRSYNTTLYISPAPPPHSRPHPMHIPIDICAVVRKTNRISIINSIADADKTWQSQRPEMESNRERERKERVLHRALRTKPIVASNGSARSVFGISLHPDK